MTKDTSDELLDALRGIDAKLGELVLLTRFTQLGPEKILHFLCEDTDVQMYLPDGDVDFVQRKILLARGFFEDMQLRRARKYIPEGAVVYDLGANIGNHSVYFGKICGASRVVAFEAQTHCHRLLARNLELNGLTGAEAHHCLLGRAGGNARLRNQNIGNLGATSFVETPGAKGSYAMRAVDEFGVHESRLDFLKIDVEGMQIPVLDGAAETLARHKPTIWIELREKFDEVEETTDYLAERGYAPVGTLSPHDHVFQPV